MIHKLQDNKGSSMILALFLMLVSLMVSNTILAAAASASRSFLTQTDRQQSFLTVSSAAQVFRDSVATGNCNYSRTVITVIGAADKEEKKRAMSGPFSQEIGDAVEALLGAYAATGYERDYLITVGSSAEEFEPMNLHLRLEKTDSDEDTDMVQDCLLTATFSNVLPQSTAAMVSGYTPPYAPTQMVLTLRGSLSHTETENGTLEENKGKRVTDAMQWHTDTIELSKPVQGEGNLP